MGTKCSAHWREEVCTEGFSGKPEGKNPLGNPYLDWEERIKMNLTEIRWGGISIAFNWLRIETSVGPL
jgi:hypothetical protein